MTCLANHFSDASSQHCSPNAVTVNVHVNTAVQRTEDVFISTILLAPFVQLRCKKAAKFNISVGMVGQSMFL